MSTRPIVPVEWTLTVEASGGMHAQAVDGNAVESLIDLLAEHSASVSHLPRRYTTRLRVYAHDVLEAVDSGVKVWKQAVEDAGLPEWPVVRVEAARSDDRR